MNADKNFSRPGAMDLSSLAAASSAPAAPAGGQYVIEVTEQNFESVAQQSMQYAVVLAFTSTQDPASGQVVKDLTELINELGGRMMLAIVDVSAQQRIAQALGVQAVPTAIAMIAGQLAPLFQGSRDRADIKSILAQVGKLAMENGLTGRAQPVAHATTGDDGEPAVDPRFAAADQALQKGDFAQAVAEFDKLLKANPRDSEAQAGRAQAALLMRTGDLDLGVISKADQAHDDLDLQLQAADAEMVAGRTEQAFTRLIDVVRRTADDDREKARTRLVELFETADPTDPSLAKARRSLAMVLF